MEAPTERIATEYTLESMPVQDLFNKGYSVLTLKKKDRPPKGFTGYTGEVSTTDNFASSGSKYIAIRHYDTFAVDIDTDSQAGHKVVPNPHLAEIWRKFLDTFSIEPVRTGANLANGAGIYHFNYETNLGEDDVKVLSRIPGLDVIRRGHRYAVVRGIHPNGNEYQGSLPDKPRLPVFTREHLDWLSQHIPVTVPESWSLVVTEWETDGYCKQVSQYVESFNPVSNRHDSFRDAIYHLACLGSAGHSGVKKAIGDLSNMWADYGDKQPAEFNKMLNIKRLPAQMPVACGDGNCSKRLSLDVQVALQTGLYPAYALAQSDNAVQTLPSVG